MSSSGSRSDPICRPGRGRRARAVVRAWHDSYVPVVLLIAGLVILIAVILVAAGRGGELPAERADYAPLDLGPVSATDVALLRPPANAWGYNMQATDEAMAQIAESIRERDIRIVALEQLVTDLSREPAPPPLASPYVGVRRRALPEGVQPVTGTGQQQGAPLAPLAPEPDEGHPAEQAHPAGTTWSAETAWSRESARPAEQSWPATPTRPDIPAWPGEGDAAPEAGHPAEAPQSPGEGQVGPPERSHD
jgi:hypothetical protein